VKSNHDMFAARGNPWITERDRAEGRIHETRARSEPDLPPSKALRVRWADGSEATIDVKRGERKRLYERPEPVEVGRSLGSLTKDRNIGLRMQMRRAMRNG
jgi:hypothetical protein